MFKGKKAVVMEDCSSGEEAAPAFRPALLLLVAAAAFATFSPTLLFGLVWDDLIILEAIEAEIRSGDLARLAMMKFPLGSAEGLSAGYYRPLVLLSFYADHRLLPAMPWAYHLTNVLLHTLASVLLFQLLALALRSPSGALAGALLFAVHPVHTESVAFVSGRTDLMAAVFVLLSTIFWVRDRRGLSRRPWAERALAALSLLFALLSKEVAVMLPAVLIAWDSLVPPGGGPPPAWWMRNRAWIGVWVLALAAAALIRWAVAGVGIVWSAPASAVPEIPGGVALLANKLMAYLRLLVFPWPPNAFYTPDRIMWDPLSILGAALLAGGCGLLATRRSDRIGAVGLAWIVGFLVPVSGLTVLIGSAVISERYLYLPSAGLSLVAGWVVARKLADSRPRVLWPAVAVLTVILAASSIARSSIWRDEITLFSQLTRESPRVWLAWFNLGNAHSREGRHSEAVESYRAAAALNPTRADIHYNLGNSLSALGRHGQAVAEYLRAVELSPAFADAYFNLGNAYLMLGMARESREAFARAAALDSAP